MEGSRVADVKPRLPDSGDRTKGWKFPDIVESGQLKALRLPDTVTVNKVCWY